MRYREESTKNPLRAADVSSSIASGVVGAVALTAFHEAVRSRMADPPRIDRIGERAIRMGMSALGAKPPAESRLYGWALAGDIVTNGLFYSLVGTGGGAWLRGALLGSIAGVGAALLPPVLGLGKIARRPTKTTNLLTFSYYLTGGLVAAAASRAISATRQAWED